MEVVVQLELIIMNLEPYETVKMRRTFLFHEGISKK